MHFMDMEQQLNQMRNELTSIGIRELKTPEEVDEALGEGKGTAMVVVNSVCGCAAGNARPGIALALNHNKLPEKMYTVFAGQDKEATTRAREKYFTGVPSSSPSVVLLKDGKIAFVLHRTDIEDHSPEQVAQALTRAFDAHC